jgi:acetyltransferase-like isoleucine patch superfamily enzyme
VIYKVIWAIRAIIFGLFFGRFGHFGYIGSPKFLFGVRKIFVGNRVRIMPGARMEVHGKGRLVIGDNCSIGNDLHISVADELIIGSGALISSSVLITDIDHEYQEIDIPVFYQPLNIRKTYIGENVFIGSGAKILAGTIIGKGCVVGANSVIRGEYAPHSVIAGIPGKVVKYYVREKRVWLRKGDL